MKVTVNKYLNARIKGPYTGSEMLSYKKPGAILTIDQACGGTEIEGNSVWYHCSDDDCFYWSGGIAHTSELLENGAASLTDKDKMAIYKSAANELASLYAKTVSGFRGLGVGYKYEQNVQTQKVCLIFYVFSKTVNVTTKVPAKINYRGIELITDVREVGNIQFHAAETFPPYMMGGSIAEINGSNNELSIGTRTLLVSKNNNDYLMTCFHVACYSLLGTSSAATPNTINTHFPAVRYAGGGAIQTSLVAEGYIGPNYEYALVNAQNIQVQNFLPDNTPINAANYLTFAELESGYLNGMTFLTYGAITQGLKTATFIAYHTNNILVDTQHNISMSGLIETTVLSQPGDSGAPVLDNATKRLIGFVIAGNGSSSFILPFARFINFGITPK